MYRTIAKELTVVSSEPPEREEKEAGAEGSQRNNAENA